MALKPLPKFVKTTYAAYKGLGTKDENTLYFITDTAQHQIYLGNAPYSMTPIILGSTAELPAVADAIPNALYYKTKDNTAHIFDGTAFHALSVPKASSISTSLAEDDGTVPTTYAAKQYVDSQVSSVVSSSADGKIDKFNGTANHIVYVDSTSTKAQVKDSGLVAGGAALAGTPNSTTLATEAAVSAAIGTASSALDGNKVDKFNGTANHFVFVDSTSTKANVKDSGLVAGGASLSGTPNSTTLATEAAVAAADAAVLSSAQSYADSAVSALGTVFNYKGTVANLTALEAIDNPKGGDVYQVTSVANGTGAEYVYNGTAWEELGTALDLSAYTQKVTPTAAGNVATLAADGSLQDSSKSIGGATLTITGDAASADVIATEAAVKTYADQVASAAAGAYIPFISNGSNTHIPTIASNGEKLSDSGVVIGGATLAGTPDSSTVATEAAVAAADAAVSSAVDAQKIDKFSGTANHIVFVDSTSTKAQVKDSGIVVGGATLAASPVSTTLATEAAVSAAISDSASSKLDKLSSASSHTDKVVFFADGGTAVSDKGYGVDVSSFAATPSSSTLTTEAAVADYVTSAMQAIAWTTLS